MPERRITSRQKSFLQGRIFYNHRRSTVDCLVRDVSDTGAKLVFGGTVNIPDVVELSSPTRTKSVAPRCSGARATRWAWTSTTIRPTPARHRAT